MQWELCLFFFKVRFTFLMNYSCGSQMQQFKKTIWGKLKADQMIIGRHPQPIVMMNQDTFQDHKDKLSGFRLYSSCDHTGKVAAYMQINLLYSQHI